MAHVIDREEWAVRSDHWKGELQCGAYDSNSCLIFNYLPDVGGGPRLHKHPYAETFIIRRGSATFTIGSSQVIGRAGQVLIAPAETPHKFSTGPGGYEAVHIHASPRFVTDWLE